MLSDTSNPCATSRQTIKHLFFAIFFCAVASLCLPAPQPPLLHPHPDSTRLLIFWSNKFMFTPGWNITGNSPEEQCRYTISLFSACIWACLCNCVTATCALCVSLFVWSSKRCFTELRGRFIWAHSLNCQNLSLSWAQTLSNEKRIRGQQQNALKRYRCVTAHKQQDFSALRSFAIT